MSIVRLDPFRDITSFRDDISRLFARSLGEGVTGTHTWAPAVDVFETKDAVVLKEAAKPRKSTIGMGEAA